MGSGQKARLYTTRDLAVLAAAFALVAFLLESEAMVGWATRMEAGGSQQAWLSGLAPAHAALASVGLDRPRRAAMRLASRIDRGTRPFAPAEGADDARAMIDDLVRENALGETPVPVEDGGVSRDAGTVAPPAAHTGPVTVMLVGDSMMAVGTAPSILRILEADSRFRVVPAYRSATGLIRPDVYDWEKVYPRIAERYRPSLAVCALGGNDAAAVKHEGRLILFGNEEWDALYSVRVRSMMKALTSEGTKALWIGLPVMRSKGFTNNVRRLNRIVAEVAATVPGVTYMESTPWVAEADGSYAPFRQNAKGKGVAMRTADGIHFSDEGGDSLAPSVVQWIRENAPAPAGEGGAR